MEVNPLAFPSASHPVQVHPSQTWAEEPLVFDPTVHLAFKQPDYVVDLNFRQHAHSTQPPSGIFPGLCFTAPFQLLTTEGVRAFRQIMDLHSGNTALQQSDSRTPLCLRGLGYVSPFIRDFNRCPELDQFLSELAQDPLYSLNKNALPVQMLLPFIER